MSNREQNIEAMALARHVDNHAPRGEGDWCCPHVEAVDCINDTKYRYLEEEAKAYDALLQALTPEQRAVLEGDGTTTVNRRITR